MGGGLPCAKTDRTKIQDDTTFGCREEARVSGQAEVTNFHPPVSLLPVIGKTLTIGRHCTRAHDQPLGYLEENETLSDKQTEFRPNRSIHVLLRATI